MFVVGIVTAEVGVHHVEAKNLTDVIKEDIDTALLVYAEWTLFLDGDGLISKERG